MIKKFMTKRIGMFIMSIALFAVLQALAAAGILNPYHLQILSLMCINIILAVSLNLINGFTGQFSIGHAGFMAVGGYTAALMTNSLRPILPIGTNPVVTFFVFIIVLVCAGLVSAFIGFLIGLPTLRLRGDYLAIATLGFGEIIRVIIVNLDVIGGPRGYGGMPRITSFTWAFFVMLACVYVISNFINSTHGRACISIREDEIAAETMGIDTTKYKVIAFTMGAFFAGVAGALFAHLLTYLNPSMFGFLKSIDILVMVVIGGLGSITGSIASAVFITLLTEFLREFVELRMVIFSLMLIVVMLTRPQGLLGNKEFSLDMFKSIGAKKRARKGEDSHEA